ncbi:MAG: energy-coupling factor ABC transporter ATP-binding protein [Deltaproteobacteria bacterium]|jgi:cobalt/nickel transport system ATP-binding protein|nr:energy-coupling factor ABC transporter ATP-binding protein [Deltaproteobacteria bacterium]
MRAEPLFELKEIAFGYRERPPILKGASLALYPGERLALTGRNGCGKTTVLSIVMGLLRPLSGEVWIFGRKREKEKDFRETRPLLGFVFQDANDQLFSPTVYDDIAFGPLNMGATPKEAGLIVGEVLESLGLEGFGPRVTHDLSGGEKKLVSLGTALALSPRTLILDEPSNFLDQDAQDRLVSVLNARKLPLLIVSHDFAFLRTLKCRFLTLSEGVIKNLEDPELSRD